VAKLTAEETQLKDQHAIDLAAKEAKLKEANDAIIAVEKKRADDSAAIQALKTKLSMAFGALALICTIGAIYLPVGKGFAIVVGLIATAAATLIWVITGVQVAIGCGVGLLIALGYLLYKHHIADKGVKAFANLLGEKPELVAAADEWTTKYVTSKDGTVTTVPDTAVQALVKSKLIANDKA
jgi:hypothetical protein